MITLNQARKLRNGEYLTQQDIDAVNCHNSSDYDKLKTAENWAYQYAREEWVEGQRANKFNRDAYGY